MSAPAYAMGTSVAVEKTRTEIDALTSPKSTARAAVDAIVADLTDRRGLKWVWAKIDERVVDVILETWRGFVSDAIAATVEKALTRQAQRHREELELDVTTAFWRGVTLGASHHHRARDADRIRLEMGAIRVLVEAEAERRRERRRARKGRS